MGDDLMNEVLFPRFLEDPAEYSDAERWWNELFAKIAREWDVAEAWMILPRTQFVDGRYLLDGNPILAATSAEHRKAIRVIQADPKTTESGVHAWLGTKPMQGDRSLLETYDELVILCTLTTQTAEYPRLLVREWLNPLTTLERVRSAIDATYDAQGIR
jgi:hypothetical protein